MADHFQLVRELRKRHGSVLTQRAPWLGLWRDTARFLLPAAERFEVGGPPHAATMDNCGTMAVGVLAAGMMSHNTSPARPWFKLATPDPEMANHPPIQRWLDECATRMHTVFQRSNTYRVLHTMYRDLAVYGTACSIVVPDRDTVIHLLPQRIGGYCLAADWTGTVDTIYREFKVPVHALVQEFGLKACTPHVQDKFRNGDLDIMVDVVHVIEPRRVRDIDSPRGDQMPWRSVYYEASADHSLVLREGGFQRFTALCPRWHAAPGEVYGSGPGFVAIGDVQQLQVEQLRKSQGIDYMTNPPLQAPLSMMHRETNMAPGGITFVDEIGPQASVRSMFDVRLDLSHLLMDIQDVRQRIKSAFYVDMFLMLAGRTDTTMTATEVAERHEEKLLMVGPVVERLKNELLDPLVEATFDTMAKAGALPPAPQELHGVPLDIELVSVLAQAQRAVSARGVERFLSSVGASAQILPDALDRVDADELVEELAGAYGVKPKLVRSREDADAIRQARAQAQQAAQQAAMAQQGAQTAKVLADTSMQDGSALAGVLTNLQGYQ